MSTASKHTLEADWINKQRATHMAMKVKLSARELLVNAGLDKSVWGLDIIKAAELGRVTYEMKQDAQCWSSCACGKLDAHIQKTSDGEPEDYELRRLGYEFSKCARQDRIVDAAETLIAIEARSIELFNEVA
jgi:hypothetical protein